VTVRDATTDDVFAIREVARETWHAAYDDVIGADAVDEQVDEWYAPDVVESGVEREDWPYLVAERDGRVVGYANGGPSDDGPADAVLAAIYVRPSDWGSGTGSALLVALHERLRDLGCGSVWLAVLADNDRALSFYERHDYAHHTSRVATVGGVEADELVLRRPL
jgi:GNAT superfamily N-acetyltransferase